MFQRFRPARRDEQTRRAHRENRLSDGDLIWPVFLIEEERMTRTIRGMPGVRRFVLDELLQEIGLLSPAGLRSVLVFGVPGRKGIERAWDSGSFLHRGISAIRKKFPRLEIITDVCLCSYTEDGHCHTGDNDETCELLAKIAVSHAEAGAAIVAPSDMMDGRVHFIRRALDARGRTDIPVMSYAAKFASAFYGPFRDAAHCAPRNGDRKDYQMDPPNAEEALREVAADLEEGAASVIIKPALSYLDVIQRVRKAVDREVVAFNVSGEYSMLRHLADSKLAGESVIAEALVSMKRAGAHRIITYFTPWLLSRLLEKGLEYA